MAGRIDSVLPAGTDPRGNIFDNTSKKNAGGNDVVLPARKYPRENKFGTTSKEQWLGELIWYYQQEKSSGE